MKVKFLFSFFFLAYFCVASVFAQIQQSDLETKFIKLTNIKLPKDKCYGDACNLDEKTKDFLLLFRPLLSKRGSVEVDTRSNTLLITDTLNRLKVNENFAKILDESSLGFDNLFSRKSDELGVYPLKIKLQNLALSISCGSGQEKISWQEKQSEILLSTIKNFLSEKAAIEVDGREKTLTITDDWNRVMLIKQMAELFDKPLLEEVN